MVLNSGHDQGVDKWALGVLMYEMLTGNFTERVFYTEMHRDKAVVEGDTPVSKF
jgi:serine/threonine protein kinase